MREWLVRPEVDGDVDAIGRVVAGAFAGPASSVPPEVHLVEALRASVAWLPGLSMVAETSTGEVVAHALLTRVVVGEARLPALSLAPVSVLPKYQGQGAGTAVVRACLDAADAMGERLVLVLGSPLYYARFRFVAATRLGLHSRWSDGDEYQALTLPEYHNGPHLSGEVHFADVWDSF